MIARQHLGKAAPRQDAFSSCHHSKAVGLLVRRSPCSDATARAGWQDSTAKCQRSSPAGSTLPPPLPGLTYGLQVIEGLHHAGVEFRSLAEDFDTATSTGKLQLTMVLAFSEWWRNSIRERSVAGQAKARAEGRFPSKGEHLAGKHACEGEVLPGEPVESPASRTARITRHG